MKGQTAEERDRILGIAGNPEHALVEKLNSIPNSYRILQRSYFYDKNKKRSGGKKKAIGVVINDQFLSIDEYHSKYTHRGTYKGNIDNNIPDTSDTSGNIDIGCVHQKILGAIPILYETAINCNLVNDLYDSYGVDIGNKMLSLAFHWIQERDNAARRFPRFSSIFALPFQGHISEQEIANLYSFLGCNKTLLSKLFSLRCKRLDNGSCVNYDSTSIPTKASDIYQGKVSKSKEGIYTQMVHFSLLTEQKTGMPLLFSTFSGNEPDCSTIPDLTNKIQEFLIGNKNIIFIFDRGYETFENLIICLKEEQQCLMAARILQQDIILKARKNCTDFSSSSSIIPGTRVHGHSEQINIEYRGNKYDLWVHIFKDDNSAAKEYMSFLKKLDEFEKQWNNYDNNKRKLLLSNKLAKFYKDSGLESNLERLPDKIDEYTKDFGYFASVSTFEITSAEAYKKYKARDSIEKCFESGKMNINLDTTRAHFQDTMEGRFVIGYISLIILSELRHQLSKLREFSDKRKKSIQPYTYSITDIIDMTRGTTINYAEKIKQHWIGNAVKEIQRLCQACGISEETYKELPKYIKNPRDICYKS